MTAVEILKQVIRENTPENGWQNWKWLGIWLGAP